MAALAHCCLLGLPLSDKTGIDLVDSLLLRPPTAPKGPSVRGQLLAGCDYEARPVVSDHGIPYPILAGCRLRGVGDMFETASGHWRVCETRTHVSR